MFASKSRKPGRIRRGDQDASVAKDQNICAWSRDLNCLS
jgi:hypothetical protein